MPSMNQIALPSIVRVKPGALDRVGIYLSRESLNAVAVLQSKDLVSPLPNRLRESLRASQIEPVVWREVSEITLDSAVAILTELPATVSAIVGLGGGRALDVAKYVANLARLPYFAVPTSLSNDGFCSPQASLIVAGKRRSLPTSIPHAVVIDNQVCGQAPRRLSLSGVGDLVAKFTAVRDWKMAFHHGSVYVDDFAALLSDGSVHAFLSQPAFDEEGMRLLATSLLMNGIAMAMSGSSRPASGSEHLISHALDQVCEQPKLHGLQVGVATYTVSILQGENTKKIARLFQLTGFWDVIKSDPFKRPEWLRAVEIAPSIKPHYYTVLSSRDVMPEVKQLLRDDPHLSTAIT